MLDATPQQTSPSAWKSAVKLYKKMSVQLKAIAAITTIWIIILAHLIVTLRLSWMEKIISTFNLPVTVDQIQQFIVAALIILAAFALNLITKTSFSGEKTANEIRELRSDFNHFKTKFKDYVDAEPMDNAGFRDGVEKTVLEAALRKDQRKNRPLRIDLLAVSMRFSQGWFHLLLQKIRTDYPNLSIDVRIAIVNPDLLQTLLFHEPNIDWPLQSFKRIGYIREELKPLVKNSNGNLRIQARYINNLPHWHGVLIERDYLYLGRVSWNKHDDKANHLPVELTCSDNGYRRYTKDDAIGGSDRINLFSRWMAHYSYSECEGPYIYRPLLCTITTTPTNGTSDFKVKAEGTQLTLDCRTLSHKPLLHAGEKIEIDLNVVNSPQRCRLGESDVSIQIESIHGIDPDSNRSDQINNTQLSMLMEKFKSARAHLDLSIPPDIV